MDLSRFRWTPNPLQGALVATALACLLHSSTAATEFFVATTGSNTNPGTQAAPFRTIQHAADLMQPGDACVLRGGTYRETVRPRISGAPGKPLRFVAFGGESVTVSGADLLAGDWSVHGGNVYKGATDKRFVQLFADGKMMYEARWPNSPLDDPMVMNRAEAGAGTDYDTLADPSLPPGDWNGALVLIWPGSRWTNSTRQVVDYVAGKGFRFDRTLRPAKADPYHETDPYRPRPGNPYLLFGSLAGLDTPGEWCLDADKGVVYLFPVGGGSPASHTIEVKQRDYAFDLSRLGCVEVHGVNVFAAAVNMTDAHDCLLENCRLRYPEHLREIDGYKMPPIKNVVTGRNNEWRHCSIACSATTALRLAGENNRLVNSLVHEADYLGTSRGGLELSGTGAVVRQCTLFRAGRDIVQHGGAKKIHVEYCDIHHANLLNNDSGATYAWGTDGEGSVLAYNWIHDNAAANGIYLDNFCKNFVVHHNVIWDCGGNAIRLNSDANNHLICNNTLTRCTGAFGVYTYSGHTPTQQGTRLVNNLLTGRLKQSDPAVFVQGELGPELDHNGSYPMDARGVPTPTSGAIDAGVEVPGLTDGFKGKAPDLGAYEFGGDYWVAGADWTEEPGTPSLVKDLRFEPRPPVTEATMITEGLQLWLDAADAASVEAEANGSVLRWQDNSAHRRDAVPAKPGSAFVLQPGALNGKPVVHFGGADSLKLGTFRTGPGPLTVLVVSQGREAAGAGWQRIVGARTGSGFAKDWEEPNWILARPGGGKPAAYGAELFTLKRRNAYVLEGVVLGGSTSADTQYLDADIAEVLVYDHCLAEDEDDALQEYLAKKWGFKLP